MAAPPLLSPAEFKERLDQTLSLDLTELREAYRKQQLRILVIVVLAWVGVLLGLLTFLPTTMLIFLLILYLLYFFGFGRRRRVRRVKLHVELRRMLIRKSVELSGRPYTFHTHRYMPSFVFTESELFPFEPEQYHGDELVEAGEAGGRISFSRIKAEEHIDAFERGNEDLHRFDGWLFRIFPDRSALWAKLDGLPEHYRSRRTEKQVWMAIPMEGKLYRKSLLQVDPQYERCYELYSAIMHALALAEG